jgi:HipA-like C-terminal domain
MSECRLLPESGLAHFMTRRFDRDVIDGQTIKHHVQTLCGMDHLDFKQRSTHAYAQLFIVASQLRLGDVALEQIFRRMAFRLEAASPRKRRSQGLSCVIGNFHAQFLEGWTVRSRESEVPEPRNESRI